MALIHQNSWSPSPIDRHSGCVSKLFGFFDKEKQKKQLFAAVK